MLYIILYLIYDDYIIYISNYVCINITKDNSLNLNLQIIYLVL